MNFTVFLIGIGLSMDAFAVSVCKGVKMPKFNFKQTFIISLFFGAFQAIMPLIGFYLGISFKDYIESIDHWVAFVLLVFIGAKMAIESFKDDDENISNKFDIKELFVLSVATSIDALAVGIAFAIDDVNIFAAVTLIGVTTFVLSAIGVFIGYKFGEVYKSKAELAGGIILILIGIKVLLEHLNVISF